MVIERSYQQQKIEKAVLTCFVFSRFEPKRLTWLYLSPEVNIWTNFYILLESKLFKNSPKSFVSLLSRSKCNFHKSKIFRGAVTDKINCCRVLLPMRLTYQNRGISLELHLMYLELQTFSLNGLHDSSIMWLRNENVARDVASFCLCYTTLYYYDINSSIWLHIYFECYFRVSNYDCWTLIKWRGILTKKLWFQEWHLFQLRHCPENCLPKWVQSLRIMIH